MIRFLSILSVMVVLGLAGCSRDESATPTDQSAVNSTRERQTAPAKKRKVSRTPAPAVATAVAAETPAPTATPVTPANTAAIETATTQTAAPTPTAATATSAAATATPPGPTAADVSARMQEIRAQLQTNITTTETAARASQAVQAGLQKLAAQPLNSSQRTVLDSEQDKLEEIADSLKHATPEQREAIAKDLQERTTQLENEMLDKSPK